MCGVFGFCSEDGRPVDLNRLKKLARVTESRGKHAWGMSWIDGKGRMRMYKQTGPISNSLSMLAMAKDARLLIGHCRYATHGNPENNLNNHPHPCDGGWFVHNGVVADHEELTAERRLYPVTGCDSEVLGLMIERETGAWADRVGNVLDEVTAPNLVILGLWKPGHLIFARRGNPLHVGDAPEGTYLASLADGLPGPVHMVARNQVFEYTLKDYADAI